MSLPPNAEVLSGLGGFYMSWSAFDLILEIIAKDELGIDSDKAHVVFGTLQMQTKQNIVIALLSLSMRANKDALIRQIRAIPEGANRNLIAHGILSWGKLGDLTDITFHSRKIDGGKLAVRRKNFAANDMVGHGQALNRALSKLQREAGISEDDFQQYFTALKAFRKE